MDWKLLLPPVLAELVFIIYCIFFPHETLLAYVILYAALMLYYFRRISPKRMHTRLRKERNLWVPVLLGFCGAAVVHLFTQRMWTRNYLDGRIAVWTNGSALDIFLFALMCFILRPVAEEHFFRRGLISFENKKMTAFTVVVSLLLNALIYTDFAAYPQWLILFGIAKSILIALPFTLVYLKTRSTSVSIAVHMVYCLLQELPNVVYDIARFTLR